MHTVRIPAMSIKGSQMMEQIEEGSVLFVPDRWVEEDAHPMHTLFVGDVEIHCNGFTINVERNGGFMTLDMDVVTESSWDRYMAVYPKDWLEGSGRFTYEGTERKAVWHEGAHLLVSVSNIEIEVLTSSPA